MSHYTENLQVYLVGGAVRDQLLGMEVKDRDWVVVGATPEEMLKRGFRAVGRDFPVFLHPLSHEEYALARTERKIRAGYSGFEFDTSPDVTLQQDLARRDLTINAMAQSETGELIDPFGGAQDLRRKILRHTSPAFIEDPVRVLRVARFVARFDFKVANETLTLLTQMVQAGEVDALVAERVWQETEHALAERSPSRYLETLRQCGALRKVFPEIDALFGIPQRGDYHPEIDTGVHTLMALSEAARLSDDTKVRFATLVHDLGKALTPEDELPSHRGHEKNGKELIAKLCDRLRVPKAFRDLAQLVCRYHLRLHRIDELKPATILNMIEALDPFRKPKRSEQFMHACEADYKGRMGSEEKNYPQAEQLRRCIQAVKQIDTAAVASSSQDGAAIAEEIRMQRLSAIARLTPDQV
ncbi:MAG: multifunctional CCA addition/repair protein [Gammaproteobacteria bacterium]|nr:multifunctional CCA addition/repair protein [Gammaproteobacteria bacterium]